MVNAAANATNGRPPVGFSNGSVWGSARNSPAMTMTASGTSFTSVATESDNAGLLDTEPVDGDRRPNSYQGDPECQRWTRSQLREQCAPIPGIAVAMAPPPVHSAAQ